MYFLKKHIRQGNIKDTVWTICANNMQIHIFFYILKKYGAPLKFDFVAFRGSRGLIYEGGLTPSPFQDPHFFCTVSDIFNRLEYMESVTGTAATSDLQSEWSEEETK